jgi:hypothetical protein
MKKEIKEYLESLKNKFDSNENWYQLYKMKGSKIEELGTSTTQKGLNELVSSKTIEELSESGYTKIIKVYYSISLLDYNVGPLSITCSITPISNGKQSKKNAKSNGVFWTEKELEKYKLKKGDFKLIVKGLLDESIESNPFKKYTRSDLD